MPQSSSLLKRLAAKWNLNPCCYESIFFYSALLKPNGLELWMNPWLMHDFVRPYYSSKSYYVLLYMEKLKLSSPPISSEMSLSTEKLSTSQWWVQVSPNFYFSLKIPSLWQKTPSVAFPDMRGPLHSSEQMSAKSLSVNNYSVSVFSSKNCVLGKSN